LLPLFLLVEVVVDFLVVEVAAFLLPPVDLVGITEVLIG
jgi:hypothetical protein